MRSILACVLVVLLVTTLAPPMSAAQSSSDSALAPSGFDLQGHRGARGLAPENTLLAFRKALDLGVTTLEMDVVISQDGRVVVSHEPWMNPEICLLPGGDPIPEGEGKAHNLYAMPYAKIATYDCGSPAHPRFPEQENAPAKKPLLADVIEMAEQYVDLGGRDRPVFYNIETKSRPSWDGRFHPAPDSFAQAVVDVLKDTNITRRATIQSFDPRTLQAVHAMDVPVRIALLVASMQNLTMDAAIEQLGFTPDVYSPQFTLVDADVLAQARRQDILVVPWTVNEAEAMQRLANLGVDGLITDYPNRAARLNLREE
jgi:glycerophosphoryl diester phosphodiesterase